jgi:putative ABC transport system permease protein
VAKELAIVFGAPLAVAALNTFVASYPLVHLAGLNMKDIFLLMLAVYALLYGLYYLLTLNKYVKTVT